MFMLDPATLLHALFFWSLFCSQLTIISINLSRLYNIYKVAPPPIRDTSHPLRQIESFCNMRHEAVFKVVRGLFLVASLAPVLTYFWVLSFSRQGQTDFLPDPLSTLSLLTCISLTKLDGVAPLITDPTTTRFTTL